MSEKTVYDVISPIVYKDKKDDNKEKTFWQNIGKGFSGEKGISIVLNALPIGNKLLIVEHKDKKE